VLCPEVEAPPWGVYSMRLSQKLLQEAKDSCKCWYTLNESYSVQKLTFETDRLPAVSGVAFHNPGDGGPPYKILRRIMERKHA
jgi:hypothetical protein